MFGFSKIAVVIAVIGVADAKVRRLRNMDFRKLAPEVIVEPVSANVDSKPKMNVGPTSLSMHPKAEKTPLGGSIRLVDAKALKTGSLPSGLAGSTPALAGSVRAKAVKPAGSLLMTEGSTPLAKAVKTPAAGSMRAVDAKAMKNGSLPAAATGSMRQAMPKAEKQTGSVPLTASSTPGPKAEKTPSNGSMRAVDAKAGKPSLSMKETTYKVFSKASL